MGGKPQRKKEKYKETILGMIYVCQELKRGCRGRGENFQHYFKSAKQGQFW